MQPVSADVRLLSKRRLQRRPRQREMEGHATAQGKSSRPQHVGQGYLSITISKCIMSLYFPYTISV